MANLLFIGGGLAALYFATKGKAGKAPTTENTTYTPSTGNTSGGGVTTGNNTPTASGRAFDVQLLGIDGANTGFYKILGVTSFRLKAKIKITNISGGDLVLKKIEVVSPLAISSRISGVYTSLWKKGESRDVEFSEPFRTVLDGKNLTADQILKSIEFKTTI